MNYFKEPFKIPFHKTPCSINCGGYFSGILTEENELFVFGQNVNLELGFSSTKSVFVPTKIEHEKLGIISSVSMGKFHMIICNFEGELFGCGSNS